MRCIFRLLGGAPRATSRLGAAPVRAPPRRPPAAPPRRCSGAPRGHAAPRARLVQLGVSRGTGGGAYGLPPHLPRDGELRVGGRLHQPVLAGGRDLPDRPMVTKRALLHHVGSVLKIPNPPRYTERTRSCSSACVVDTTRTATTACAYGCSLARMQWTRSVMQLGAWWPFDRSRGLAPLQQ